MADHAFGIQDCITCRFAQPVKLQPGHYECHRHPPTAVPVQGNGGLGTVPMWPPVGQGMGCGDGMPKFTIGEFAEPIRTSGSA